MTRFPPLDAQNDPLGTPLGPMKNKVFCIIMLKTLLKIRYSEHDDDDYDGYKNHNFSIFNAINSLFHYAHRVGHVFFMRFAPLDAQNDPVGSRL